MSYARNRCLSQIFQLLKEIRAGTAESAKPVYKKFVILKQQLRRTLVSSLMPVMVMKFIVMFAVRPAFAQHLFICHNLNFNQGDPGDLIVCDAKDCPFVFHFKCAGLSEELVPEGD